MTLDSNADDPNMKLEPFDLLCHVDFDRKLLTQREWAENIKKRYVFTEYGPQARAMLNMILKEYRDDTNVLKNASFAAISSNIKLIKASGRS